MLKKNKEEMLIDNIPIASLCFFVYSINMVFSLPFNQTRDGQKLSSTITTTTINEFNISDLSMYSVVIDCVSNFKDKFIECNNQMESMGK